MKKDVLDAIDQNYMEKEEEGDASYKTVTGKEATSAHKMYEKSMETEPKGACRPTSYIKTNSNTEEEISQYEGIECVALAG